MIFMKKTENPEPSQTILVIEDEPSYRKLLKDQLIQYGYNVIEAQEGKKGLDIAEVEHPDLILLDIKMPGMDGIAMLDLLRKNSYGKTAKVIFLTNIEPDDKIIQKVLEDQPTYYLIKSDIKLVELIEKIKDVLAE